MGSNYSKYRPSQPSSATRMTPYSHFYANFRVNKKCEHPADIIKHQDKADCSFNSSSSPFSYNPRGLLDPTRLFQQPHSVNLKSLSPTPARAPSFHPIPDADATAIPIDLSRGISDYNLMGPLCWSTNPRDDADCVPFSVHSSSSTSTSGIVEKHLDLVPRSRDQQEQHVAKNDLYPIDTASSLTNTLLQEPTLRVPKRKFDGVSQQHESSNDKHQQREKIASGASETPFSHNNKNPKLISQCQSTKISKPTTMLEKEQVDILKKDHAPVLFPDEPPLSKTSHNVSLSGSARFRRHQVENWTGMVNEATEFRRHSGHCAIPHSYPPNQRLARWAKRQRHQYRLLIRGNTGGTKQGYSSSMTMERIQVLDRIDFCWDIQKGIWEGRYEELKQFKETNGHTKVYSNHCKNRKLQLWVKSQRHQFKCFQIGKYSNMTPDRIEMLNKLDFSWQG
jgi:hypothetical protein